MTGIYYTTADIKSIFGWESDMTIHRRRASGFLPDPDLPGKPNKWLRTKIDAIVDPENDSSSDPDFGTKSGSKQQAL